MSSDKFDDDEFRSLFSEPREMPSAGFSARVMAALPEERKEVFVYRPPISRPVWIGLGVVFLLLLGAGGVANREMATEVSSITVKASDFFTGSLLPALSSFFDLLPKTGAYLLPGLVILLLAERILKPGKRISI